MIAAFLLPFPLRGYRAPYLWVYYRLLSSFGERMLFIASKDYIREPEDWRGQNRWEMLAGNADRLHYRIPTREVMAAHEYGFLSDAVYETLLAESGGNPIAAFRRLVSERVPCLDAAFAEILSQPSAEGIEAILTWCNCPSLSAAAEEKGIPVAHLEVGPLRWPQYRPTAYFDFSGVNGNTEAGRRYPDSGFRPGAGVETELLRCFFSREGAFKRAAAEFRLGVALQVEDDSNLLAFGHGFDNQSLLVYAHLLRADGRVLVRGHPGSLFALKPDWYTVDESADSVAFIRRCEKILTINSSVGLEAMLVGKPVEVLGDCAHRFIAEAGDEQERLARLAFYLFAYLVPMQLIYEPGYLRFRLGRPSELDIVTLHLDTYLGGDGWRHNLDKHLDALIRRALDDRSVLFSEAVDGIARPSEAPNKPEYAHLDHFKPGGVVDVIVPVFRGFEETRRCIESVLKTDCATHFELVLIDDASPDPELASYCASLGDQPGVTVLANARNLGFVGSVNRGMSLHPDRDVVLLNSDTEVANDWLDRLQRCAYSQADIGTATPFSNNATICSYPVFCSDNPMPAGIGLAELDNLFSQVNAGECLEIPTAIGFCVYIRRACLNQVGVFDTENFERGYGEENDFSRRAAKAGWRNVLCADTFVFHAGGVSFQSERERLMANASEVLRRLHPDYDALVEHFVAADTPAKYRQAVDIARARMRMGLSPLPDDAPGEAGRASAPARLHVVHDLGGGLARWVRDYCHADEAAVNLVLMPYSSSHAMGEGLVLRIGKTMEPLAFWRFSTPIQATAETHPEYRQVIEAIVRDYGVGAVLVSSLIGHALDCLDTGLPTVIVNHDYYPFCPAIQIYFGGVCQHCDSDRLAECAANNPDFNPPHRVFPVAERIRVRERYLELVENNAIALVVPSRSAREYLERLAPRLGKAAFVTIPHGYPAGVTPMPHHGPAPGGKLRIVVLGMLSVSKGMRLLSEGLPQLLEFAEIHLVGAKEAGELFRGILGVHVVDQYSSEDLPAIVAYIQPDVGLLLSIVPETFSYTLSELFLLGIPPAATRLGGFAERILAGDTGYLFEPNVEAMLACLREIHADRDALRAIRARLPTLPVRTAADMVVDYRRLLPAVKAAGECALAWPQGTREPNLEQVMMQALALSRQWKEINSLRLILDMKAARLREQNHRIAGLQNALLEREQAIRRLELETCAHASVIAARDAQLAEVFASTSWAVSHPVRWAGNGLRRARLFMPLLRRPTALPSVAADVYRAWKQGGFEGMKRALIQVLLQSSASVSDSGAVLIPPPDSPPLATVPVPTDWRQAAFQYYRQSMTQGVRDAIHARVDAMSAPPLISVLVPTYNSVLPMLREMLDSVLQQWYPHWELCIADDGSDSPLLRAVLEEYAARDARVRLSFEIGNHGVSHASNRALARASGDFVVLLDHDDMLEEQALFRVAEAVLEDDPDMLYSDEVLVAEDGKTVQHFIFRPTFSPEYLRSHPYIVHLVGFKPGLLRQIGGFDETLRISQDYDLILRASEQARKITHIPEILYRWRIHGSSAGHQMIGQVMETSRTILQRHLQRCGETGEVHDGPSFNFFDVRYPFEPGSKVAIIIPTKNHGDLVKACIESIERTAGDVRHEIVLIDHESDDPASLAYFDSLRSRLTLLRFSGPFNFAAINNWAVGQLDGSHTHYLFCNNDIEAIEPGWLERMLALGMKQDVGIVGAKLYYPDRKTIQHAGVVVACCGVAENLGRFRLTSDDPLDLGYSGSLICNREVSAVTGACLLIKQSVFKAIGGFDETIAVGYGDVDLCLRVGEKGYRVLFCAKAALLHHESFTRGRSQENPHPEDSERFVEKWQALFEGGDRYFSPNLSPHSPNWQVADVLEFKLDIRRRIFKRELVSHLK